MNVLHSMIKICVTESQMINLILLMVFVSNIYVYIVKRLFVREKY